MAYKLGPWHIALCKEPNLIAATGDLIAACEKAQKAMTDEWLYQTGQFCRPQSNYPPQGTCHSGLHDAMMAIDKAIDKARGEK
uniref:Uncharacterized protein n=1 Tax=viral metagenome TaxID=1070528 RepID=A0A6M3JTS8_9ZZZZ